MRYLFLGAAMLVGCGGAVDDGAPSPSPGTNAPSSNSVPNRDGCGEACRRMTVECAAYEDPNCAQSCASNFTSPAQQTTFAECIDALSCEEIQRGATMNYGPIGECWSRARGR